VSRGHTLEGRGLSVLNEGIGETSWLSTCVPLTFMRVNCKLLQPVAAMPKGARAMVTTRLEQ
jgi:hypothetical protein